jgi:uncharacterized protein
MRLHQGQPVRRMHVMAKPIGPRCNLDCAYCYYLSKQDLLGAREGWRMSDQVLESFIRQYILGQNCEQVVFSWQGGEPTLLGLDFFQRVVELERFYCPPDMRCENDLQTNGTLLDDAWCEFLAKHGFLVGLSIDGPLTLHDRYRRDKSGRGTHARVLHAAKLLKKHGVPFATLSCVNRHTARQPLEVYRFLRDEVGSARMQFIPIVEPKCFRHTAPQYWPREFMPHLGASAARPGGPDSVVEEWSVDPGDFGRFLIAIFDEWLRHDIGRVYVHYFDALVEAWMGRISPLCTHGPMCGKGLALERDGSLFSCDHYVYPQYRLGDIRSEPLTDMAFSLRQEWFGKAKERLLHGMCRRCEWLFACFGECPKNRFLRTPGGEPGLNYLCDGWRAFYAHADPWLQRIVRGLGGSPVRGAYTQTVEVRPPR